MMKSILSLLLCGVFLTVPKVGNATNCHNNLVERVIVNDYQPEYIIAVPNQKIVERVVFNSNYYPVATERVIQVENVYAPQVERVVQVEKVQVHHNRQNLAQRVAQNVRDRQAVRQAVRQNNRQKVKVRVVEKVQVNGYGY
jgi:hypothetical protein